jgi:hypothetical protein
MIHATCTRQYTFGGKTLEFCLGEIEDNEDGQLECNSCYAVSIQLVRRKGKLFLTYEGSLGDRVLSFTTNNVNEN